MRVPVVSTSDSCRVKTGCQPQDLFSYFPFPCHTLVEPFASHFSVCSFYLLSLTVILFALALVLVFTFISCHPMNSEDITSLILSTLDAESSIANTAELRLNGATIEPEAVSSVVRSLASNELVEFSPIEVERWIATPEAQYIQKHGSHEVRVYEAIPASGSGSLSIAELVRVFDGHEEYARVGQNAAFRLKWIAVDPKGGGGLVRTAAPDSVRDDTREALHVIERTGEHSGVETLKELKRRKLIELSKVTTYKVWKGSKFALKLEKPCTELTAAMIQRQGGGSYNALFLLRDPTFIHSPLSPSPSPLCSLFPCLSLSLSLY